MSFAFNFADPSAEQNQYTEEVATPNVAGVAEIKTEDGKVEKCEEIIPETDSLLNDTDSTLIYKILDDICLRCLDSQDVEQRLNQQQQQGGVISSVITASKQHSDLIPNVYEGGLKVWECAIDLMEYLHKNNVSFTNKKVLELGCGAGLPGILAITKGAAQVHFQDYNKEVIEHYTIPNVARNQPENYTCTCRYFSGDWDHFRRQITNESIRYDIILTAETIYHPSNYGKLFRTFQHCLHDNGAVYLAAKSNYFGVGGGTRDFETFIRNKGILSIEVCHVIQEGVPREIMKLSRI